MARISLVIFLVFGYICVAFCQTENYETIASFIRLTVHREGQPKVLIDDFAADAQYASSLCPPNEKISWIIPGYGEGYAIQTQWIRPLVDVTLKAAKGCVIVMDYSYYSAFRRPYGDIVRRYIWLRDYLVNGLKMFGGYSRMHIFGFSFGARLAQGAGNILTDENNGVPVIARMDLCDPARPDFDGNPRRVDCKRSAQNVASIHTSEDLGTRIHDCHQNFKMGQCGRLQDGATVAPKRSHGMCPYFYMFAFSYDFKYDDFYQSRCTRPLTLVNETCRHNMILGYRNNWLCPGDIPITTSRCAPFVFNGKDIGKGPCPPY